MAVGCQTEKGGEAPMFLTPPPRAAKFTPRSSPPCASLRPVEEEHIGRQLSAFELAWIFHGQLASAHGSSVMLSCGC
jgi:hypothetical protein